MGINIIAAICIAMGIFGKYLTKRWLNPISVLCWMWGAIFFLASLRLFNIYSPKDDTFLLMFLAIVSFFVAFSIVYYNFKKVSISINKKRLFRNYNWNINYRLLYLLGIISILYFGAKFLSVINVYLSGGGLDRIRLLAQTGAGTNNGFIGKIINSLRVLIIIPYSLAIIPIAAANFWYGDRKNKLMQICIATVILRILSEGGRINLIYLLVDLIVGYAFLPNKIKNNYANNARSVLKRNIKKIRFLLAFLALAIIFTSVSRAGENLRRFTYYYFAMEPYMFERWKNIVDESGVYGYGVASFNGFIICNIIFD